MQCIFNVKRNTNEKEEDKVMSGISILVKEKEHVFILGTFLYFLAKFYIKNVFRVYS